MADYRGAATAYEKSIAVSQAPALDQLQGLAGALVGDKRPGEAVQKLQSYESQAGAYAQLPYAVASRSAGSCQAEQRLAPDLQALLTVEKPMPMISCGFTAQCFAGRGPWTWVLPSCIVAGFLSAEVLQKRLRACHSYAIHQQNFCLSECYCSLPPLQARVGRWDLWSCSC